jgi:SagB-type dehydrogenase family enzyme
MFRKKYPLAWAYHRNSSRWLGNPYSPEESPQATAAFKEMVDLPEVKLPAALVVRQELSETIRARLSCRRFACAEVSLQALATLLYWSYGKLSIDHPNGIEMVVRPVPSGGGLYPLELYILVQRVNGLAPGVYHYNVLSHLLERLDEGALPPGLLSGLFMSQPCVAQSAFQLVISAVFARSLWKYRDRGYRYLLFEAGHAAQNCNLVAAALGLGSLNLGGFSDADLAALLRLEIEEEAPLYAVALGQPDTVTGELLRIPERGLTPV